LLRPATLYSDMVRIPSNVLTTNAELLFLIDFSSSCRLLLQTRSGTLPSFYETDIWTADVVRKERFGDVLCPYCDVLVPL